MPCRYEETQDEIATRQNEHDNKIRAATKRKYTKELNKLTRMLCDVLKAIDEGEQVINNTLVTKVFLSKEILDWKEKHKKQDAQQGQAWK